MTIPASKTNISFQNTIEAEFGQNPQRSLGSYRISQNVGGLTGLALDTGVPQSGTIRFSTFRGKSLNVVVNLHSGGTEYHVNAKNDKWKNNLVTVVGGFRGKKENGSRIIININKQFRSQNNQNRRDNPNRCAVRTGSWGSIASMTIDVTGDGKLYGAGGRGGNGGRGYQFEGGQPGGRGSSGLGVEKNATVNVFNNAQIRAGFGGGGGGGYGRQQDKGKDRKASGGGGGGGAGLPFGEGGSVTQSPGPGGDYTNATGGTDSFALTAGDGGRGADNDSQTGGGAGGEGGQNGEFANSGGNSSAGGGAGGGNGAAIRRSGGVSGVLNISGQVIGDTNATGVE